MSFLLHPLIKPQLFQIQFHFNAFYHFFSTSQTLTLLLHTHHLNKPPFLRKTHTLPTNALSTSSNTLSLHTHFNQFASAISQFNKLMKTHADSCDFDKPLFLYKKIRYLGIQCDGFTFPIVNKAVSLLNCDVFVGEMVHCDALKLGFQHDLYFSNTMIDVYVKKWCLACARKLFDEMLQKDLVSYTTMIAGYLWERNVVGCFELLREMRILWIKPNSVTIIVILQICSECEGLSKGRLIHGYVIKYGLLVDVSVQNSILRMYSKIGCTKEVENIFDEIDTKDSTSWNTLISYHTLTGDAGKVVSGFKKMQTQGVLSSETLTLVMSILAKMGNLVDGEKLHSVSLKLGLCDDILLTCLLDLYAKCGALRSSMTLFNEVGCISRITWSAMISGFILNGYVGEAIGLFRQMQSECVEHVAEVVRGLIDACAQIGALRLGIEIHGYLVRNVFLMSEEEKIHLTTSIMNMYVRGGSISSARKCFDKMPVKDTVAWTSMIEGYGIHGRGVEALNLFDQMLKEGTAPNSATFLSALSGCSHCGLVSQGIEIFHSMKWKFGIQPGLDHYTCIVDLLGRSGKLKVALSIIIKMVTFADSRIWGALLAASRIHGDKKTGNFAAERLLELEPDNVGYYTLLSNVEADTENWNEVEQVRRVMHDKRLKKTAGWSYIEG